jgi:glycosyltransferase involved in cell wall biosynthesis
LKRICFIATTPYAVNPFLKSHLLRLSKFYEVILCVNEKVYPLDDEIRNTVSVHHFDIERKISFFRDIRALFQITTLLLKLNPGSVHSITPKAGLLAMIAGFIARVPYRLHTFTGQVWACKRGWPKFFLQLLDKVIVTFSTQIFTDSQSQSEFLVFNGVVRHGEALVLGKGSIAGVDLMRFKPDVAQRNSLRCSLGVNQDVVVFLYVGRITKDKGLYDLVSSMNLVSSQYPYAELWIVGPDEAAIQRDLSQQVSPNTRVRWFEKTFSPEEYMAAADALVLPSYREGFGSVIIEAASCGIPAIAYKTEGVTDAIEDQATGVLVEKFNIAQFSNAMIQFIENPDWRKQLGSLAQLRSREMFSSEIIAGEWEGYYRSHIR